MTGLMVEKSQEHLRLTPPRWLACGSCTVEPKYVTDMETNMDASFEATERTRGQV